MLYLAYLSIKEWLILAVCGLCMNMKMEIHKILIVHTYLVASSKRVHFSLTFEMEVITKDMGTSK